ncbi:hypothetical protein ABE288_27800 [Bacillus salipaludis]|uniref:hypothetical protein n=1 Tax=Bacillus salipaludis TaxID=2547811 RepID=UPI003D25CC58
MKFEDNIDPSSILSDALENLENADSINEAADNVEQVLGTEPGTTGGSVTIDDLLSANEKADETVEQAIANELAPACPCSATLNFHMENVTIVAPGFDTPEGVLALTGNICPNCGPAGSMFTFEFNSVPPGFTETFTGTTITSVTCTVLPNGDSTMTVMGSGTGNYNGTMFNSTFTLMLIDNEPPGTPMEMFVLSITTPNGPQVITFTQNGEGHAEITPCPM